MPPIRPLGPPQSPETDSPITAPDVCRVQTFPGVQLASAWTASTIHLSSYILSNMKACHHCDRTFHKTEHLLRHQRSRKALPSSPDANLDQANILASARHGRETSPHCDCRYGRRSVLLIIWVAYFGLVAERIDRLAMSCGAISSICMIACPPSILAESIRAQSRMWMHRLLRLLTMSLSIA